MPLINMVANIGYVAVAIVGAALAIQGAITIEYHAGRQSKRDNIVTERPGLREESPVFIKNSFQI